jgi:hypothetical protein
MWIINTAISAYTAIQTGNIAAFAVGFVASMALGGIMPTQSFSNLGMQMGVGALRGAAVGAISGGLASMAAGGSFGAGAGMGAIGGAVGGAISAFATSQQFQNWKGGYGFQSNDSVIKSFYNQGKYQEAIDYTIKTYGISSAEGATYDSTIPVGTGGTTDSVTGSIAVGPEAFTKPYTNGSVFDASRLRGTLFHEGVHAQQVANGSVHFPISNFSRSVLESQAYGQTLQNAQQLSLSPAVIQYYQGRYQQETQAQQIRYLAESG